MAYLKNVYRIVGAVIFGTGMILLPFLPHLISGDYPVGMNIYVLYVMYLVGAVVSYFFFAYKSALLTAMQRADIVSNISTVTSILLRILQIGILLLTRNFYLYVASSIFTTVLNNILLQVMSKRYFPQIMPMGKISDKMHAVLTKQIKGIVINRIGDTARNSLDNIVLSVLFGLTTVTVYGNYYYIYQALYSIALTVTRSMQASVGNSVAKESVEKNYADYRKFTYIFACFTGWMSICMVCLYQPFMWLWMRGNEDLMLSEGDMLLFCIYFYAINMNNMRNLYANAYGLYWELRMWYLLEAVGNVVLNIVLGYLFGVSGILWATILTIFFCNFISRTNVLFRHYFKRSPMELYWEHLKYACAIGLLGGLTYLICSFVPDTEIGGLVLRACICVFVPAVVSMTLFRKNEKFQNLLNMVRTIITRG
ncbi:MAG: polysaccharide biosynthesis C-terminal domain-containing protein [Butyrivibrio sp.]|nr:polysaccharide biosynthesis C-terminal domain-containing protein [Butyrivibrio sp.]